MFVDGKEDSDAILVPQEMRFCPYCGKSLDEDART
jgi:hypothetical protein